MASYFSTERMNLMEAYRRENYSGYESLLGDFVQTNDFLRTAVVLPSNHGAEHRTLMAKTLGEGSVRAANAAIKRMASKTETKSEPLISYEGDSEVDQLILASAPDPAAARMSEDALNLTGFSNGFNRVLVYGEKKTAEGFDGLQARRNKLSQKYVYDMGGSSNLCSAYLCEFGENALALRYLPGSVPGIDSRDMGLQKVTVDSEGGYFWAWVNHYSINFGLSQRLEQNLQRICNIDVTSIDAKTLFKTIIKAKNSLLYRGRNAFLYVNSDVKTAIETAMLDLVQAQLKIVDIEGYGPVQMFAQIPIMQMDALESNETKVS